MLLGKDAVHLMGAAGLDVATSTAGGRYLPPRAGFSVVPCLDYSLILPIRPANTAHDVSGFPLAPLAQGLTVLLKSISVADSQPTLPK